MSELESILSISPQEHKGSIRKYYKENGMKETVMYLADKVWDEETRQRADKAIANRDISSPYYKVLFDLFNIQKHFNQVDSHRKFISMAYDHLKEFVPNMTQDQVDKHDLSKYDFAQSVGYTARWVHEIDNDCWQKSLNDHYCKEPHHPQFYWKGEEKSVMEQKFLEESLIDMVASRWERQLQGDVNVSNYELVNFDSKYLLRYLDEDRKKVEGIINAIKNKSIETK